MSKDDETRGNGDFHYDVGGPMISAAMAARVVDPPDGSVLHHGHGSPGVDGLTIPVRIAWPQSGGQPVWINGSPARFFGAAYHGQAILRNEEEQIVATTGAPDGEVIAVSRVLYVRHSCPRYRLAIDDNIFFLEAIARERPRSLFDSFYLSGLRDLHLRYGVKIALNVFFSTPDGGFHLNKFPDDYRGEFADNASWLTLAFHAHSEFPDRPYQHSQPEKLAADYDRVAQEILRFAGDAAYSPATIIHWAMVHPDAHRVVYERGSRLLSGLFVPDCGGFDAADGVGFGGGSKEEIYDINYCLDPALSARLNRGDLLKDYSSGLIFSKVELVCNNTPPECAPRILEALARDPATAEVMDLITHEQYFWPHYKNHLPDHFQRCESAIRWCAENGYAPVFFHQGIAGAEPPFGK